MSLGTGSSVPGPGGDGVCPLSALPQLRGRWGGTRSRRRRPGSRDSGAWSDGILGGRGTPLPPGGPLARYPPQHRLSLRSERQHRHRPGTTVSTRKDTGDLRVAPCHVRGVSGDPRWQRWLGHSEDEPISEDRPCCKPRDFHTFLIFLVFGWFCGGSFGRVKM